MRSRVLVAVLALLAILGVQIALRDRASTDPGAGPASPRSDVPRAETFEIDEPRPARVERAFSFAPDATPAEWAARAPLGPSPRTGLRVRVTAAEGGAPVARARVRATTASGLEREAAPTGVEGWTAIELEPRVPYTVHARSANGLGRGWREIPALVEGEVRELVLALPTEPDRIFHGRVVDRETRAPIADARVGPSRAWLEIEPHGEERTDADGRFRVGAWSWAGAWTITARGYASAWTQLGPGHATFHGAREIVLSRAAAARITVLDAGGAPIPGAQVRLSTDKHRFAQPEGADAFRPPWPDDAHYETDTDGDGVAVLEGLLPHVPWDGAVSREGERILRTETPLRFTPGETTAVEWRVDGGCAIHGVALEHDGRPAPGLDIWLEDASSWAAPSIFPVGDGVRRRAARTDAAGRFAFAHVLPGAWRIGPAAQDPLDPDAIGPADVAPFGQLVDVPTAVPRMDVVVRIARGLSIETRVVDPSGGSTATAFVRYRRLSDGLAGDVAGRDGSRVLVGPIPEGEYELRAFASGFDAWSRPVVVRAGARNVVLQLRRGATMRGRVVDASGSARADATVRARPRGGRERDFLLAEVDQSGRFEFRCVDSGAHDVVATAPGGLFGLARDADVRPDTMSDVRVELAPGGFVNVRYAGPWPMATLRIEFDGAAVVDAELPRESEQTFVVPAGALLARIREYAGGRDVDSPIAIAAGESRTITFDRSWR